MDNIKLGSFILRFVREKGKLQVAPVDYWLATVEEREKHAGG